MKPPPTAVLRSTKDSFNVVVNAETSPFGRLCMQLEESMCRSKKD